MKNQASYRVIYAHHGSILEYKHTLDILTGIPAINEARFATSKTQSVRQYGILRPIASMRLPYIARFSPLLYLWGFSLDILVRACSYGGNDHLLYGVGLVEIGH